jgi:hypothetical protein
MAEDIVPQLRVLTPVAKPLSLMYEQWASVAFL